MRSFLLEKSNRELKILSLSTCYPNPREEAPGAFIRSRLQRMAAMAEIRVMAPVPAFHYFRGLRSGVRDEPVPPFRTDASTTVYHPRWFYPPLGTAVNALFLFLQLLWPVARLRREFPFQVIDAHFGHPEATAAALLSIVFGCPFTVTLRGSEMYHGSKPFRRMAMSWALRRASRVITVSDRLRRFALDLGVDARRTVTIPNGVDASRYHPRDRAACREKFGISTDQRLMISAGCLVELKGHHHAITAVKALRDRGVAVEFIIPGEYGPYHDALRKQIATLGLEKQVRLLGYVAPSEVAELMCAADLYCMASLREGWPNVVHESLACGTPVVATDVGAVPALIPSADYGLIVPPGDPLALAEAIDKALRTPWDRTAISVWGMSRSWEQVAAEVIQCFREIVTADRVRRSHTNAHEAV